MDKGYIRLFRKILNNPFILKDAEHLAVFIYLLLNATHQPYETIFRNEKIILTDGQLITGRDIIATKLKVNSSKVQRILSFFEKNQIIEQQTSNKNRLITIVNWCLYQTNEQQLNNKRTTNEQQSEHKQEHNNNNNNIKKEKINKKEKKFIKPTLGELKKYIQEQRLNVDAEGFIDYYEGNGWKVGRNSMRDWKATVRNWSRRGSNQNLNKTEQRPNWYGKNIEEELASEEEIQELEAMFK